MRRTYSCKCRRSPQYQWPTRAAIWATATRTALAVLVALSPWIDYGVVLTVTEAPPSGSVSAGVLTPSLSVTLAVTLSVCVKLHDVLVILPTNVQVKLPPAAIAGFGNEQVVLTTCSHVANPAQD